MSLEGCWYYDNKIAEQIDMEVLTVLNSSAGLKESAMLEQSSSAGFSFPKYRF